MDFLRIMGAVFLALIVLGAGSAVFVAMCIKYDDRKNWGDIDDY